MLSSLFYALRCLVWFPFAVTSSPSTVVIVNVVVAFGYPRFWPGSLWVSLVVCGLTLPLEYSLRPAPRAVKLKGPPREKPVVPQRAALLLREKGQAPSLAHARRLLPKELRALLAAPVARPPEAVLHGQEVMKQLAASAGRKAA